MSKWGFWDWVAYITLGVAAVILAADAGLKGSPAVMEELPALFKSHLWAFAPLVLVVVATLILLLRHGRTPNAAATIALAGEATLRLHIYPDERLPDRLSFLNVWRWYYLRTVLVSINPQTGLEHRRDIVCVLFVTFDAPVQVGTLTVSSPDIRLPPHEVKEFTNRYAIIAFSASVPECTLEIKVHQ